MQKVLITGGAGFIGANTTDKLLKNNYKIVIIDNLSSGTIKNLPESKDLELYKLNIEKDNIEEVFEKEQPDFVIHLAAQTSVNYSVLNPYIDANINIMASIRLIEICKKYNIKKFVTASSAAVYGNPKYIPIDEFHPAEPMSYYGLSKLVMEKYIRLSGIPYIIFRFSNAFGPKQKSSNESGVIAIFNKAMRENKPINIFGNGEQIRDFIYVADITDIFLKTLKSDIKNEIINFSTNKGISINYLFNKMSELYNYNYRANYLPERTGDIKDSILSNKKAIELFGNLEFTSLQSGLNALKNDKET